MRPHPVVLLAGLLGGCYGLPIGPCLSPGPLPPTVDGPESPELLERTEASLVAYDVAQGRLERIRLSDLDSTEIPTSGRVWQLAGPDADGRVLFVEEASRSCRLMLWTGGDEPPRELDSMRGDRPFWRQSMFRGLALAPTGGRVAFLRRVDRETATLEVRTLDGWRLEHEVQADWGAVPRWLADGRHVSFGRTLEPDLERFPCCTEVPLEPTLYVYVLDTETGEERALHVGWCVRTFPGEPTLLVSERNGTLHETDLASGTCTSYEELELPGSLRVLGELEQGLVLYHARATTGTEPRTVVTLQKAPQWMWSLKLADPSSGRFATVYPYVGRFHRFSYGP